MPSRSSVTSSLRRRAPTRSTPGSCDRSTTSTSMTRPARPSGGRSSSCSPPDRPAPQSQPADRPALRSQPADRPALRSPPPCDARGVSNPGRIEVVCGPMFAGKTEELLRRVRRAVIAGPHVAVIGHALDVRHGTDRLATHVGLDHPSVPASTVEEIRHAIPAGTEIVAIDEAQFFGPELVALVTELAGQGLIVIVAGLDVTFDGTPFEPLPTLMA